MTRKQFDAATTKQVVSWLRESGWVPDGSCWRLYNKNRVTLTTFKGACDMQLRRDAATRGLAKKSQELLNSEFVKGVRAGYRSVLDNLDAEKTPQENWSNVESAVNGLITRIRKRQPGEEL